MLYLFEELAYLFHIYFFKAKVEHTPGTGIFFSRNMCIILSNF